MVTLLLEASSLPLCLVLLQQLWPFPVLWLLPNLLFKRFLLQPLLCSPGNSNHPPAPRLFSQQIFGHPVCARLTEATRHKHDIFMAEADSEKENMWIRKAPVSKYKLFPQFSSSGESGTECQDPRAPASLSSETLSETHSLCGPQFPHL